MREAHNYAPAPADRRLFETGRPNQNTLNRPKSPKWAGLKVGRNQEEQF